MSETLIKDTPFKNNTVVIVLFTLTLISILLFIGLSTADVPINEPLKSIHIFMIGIMPDVIVSLIMFIVFYTIVEKSIIRENRKNLNIISNKIDEKFSAIRIGNELNEDILNILYKDDLKNKMFFKSIDKTNNFSKFFIKSCFLSLKQEFTIDSDMIKFNNQHLTLKTYIEFWRFLYLQQQTRKENSKKPIIIRALHSNSLSIWDTENSKFGNIATNVRYLQKKFTDEGGIIVRVIRGKEDFNKLPPLSKKIIAEMKNNGIEVKYLKLGKNSVDSDFLLVYDEDLIIEWQSYSDGENVATSTVWTKIPQSALRNWQNIFNELKYCNDPIESIPSERQFHWTIDDTSLDC